MTKRLLVAAAAAATLAGCGTTTADRPGSPDVYHRLAGMTSCHRLQRQFDRAMSRAEALPSGASARSALLGYAQAAEDRREELSCR